ncbi:MAG: alpha/beta fold hydrolase [Acidobacteria bacterium]|nr:MAG: alpha/beta fold hydrolase [Acidobacteriota bacterium]
MPHGARPAPDPSPAAAPAGLPARRVSGRSRFRKRARRAAALAYLAALALSTAVRAFLPGWGPPRPGQRVAVIDEREAGTGCTGVSHIAWTDRPGPPGPPVLLIHGSPGDARGLSGLAERLAGSRRVLAPDLPGHGASEREPCDLSIEADALRLGAWLDALGIERVHAVGYSLGGAVAILLADRFPERVASLTLLSATGVQELELLGDARLNHALHGLQLAALWSLRAFTPHMGLLDRTFPVVSYARTFYESDQRPLRAALRRWSGPALIVHGKADPLVPAAAALEHHRLLPQSELLLDEGDHFTVFRHPGRIATVLKDFLDRVDGGLAAVRATADPNRVAMSERPFDPTRVPPASGLALVVLSALIAAATLASEDLTCLATGALIAAGRIRFLPGTLACFAGIAIGDLGLFAAGRLLGRPALRRPPLRWLIRADQVERARAWFERRGPAAIFAARFLPGARLPVYFSAGVAGAGAGAFVLYFFAAAALWTPLVVGGAALAGRPFLAPLLAARRVGLAGIVAAVAALVLAGRLAAAAATHRGRRRLAGWFLRLRRWEFWPAWVIYGLLAPRLLHHAWRYGGLTVFTAANPCIEAGGFVGESKSGILAALERAGAPVARFRLIPPGGKEDRLRALEAAAAAVGGPPVVVKPDVGERGYGVRICHDLDQARRRILDDGEALIVQEYVPGVEFGLFYVRRPGEERGFLFSVTRKRLPEVVGDGRRTLERLILDDPRAVALAPVYFAANAGRLDDVPAAGERVRLVELGTHCRGAVFEDAAELATPELSRRIDEISRRVPGFHFGRYDVRAPSESDLARGEGIRIIELNGVTSEATHVYDPRFGLREALAVLSEQWRLAFEIGRENRARGVRPTPLRRLLAMAWHHRRG